MIHCKSSLQLDCLSWSRTSLLWAFVTGQTCSREPTTTNKWSTFIISKGRVFVGSYKDWRTKRIFKIHINLKNGKITFHVNRRETKADSMCHSTNQVPQILLHANHGAVIQWGMGVWMFILSLKDCCFPENSKGKIQKTSC